MAETSLQRVARFRTEVSDIDRERSDLVDKWNEAIRAAYKDGAPVTEITRVSGISRPTIYRILNESAPDDPQQGA